jgi:hypothetical protein
MWFRLLRQRLDFQKDVDVAKAVSECGDVLARIEHPARRTVLLGRMAGQLGLDPETLRRSLRRPRAGARSEKAAPAAAPEPGPAAIPLDSPLATVERDLFTCLLAQPDQVDQVGDATLQTQAVAEMIDRIRTLVANGTADAAGVLARLFSACNDRPELTRFLGECHARAASFRKPAESLPQIVRDHRRMVSRNEAHRLRIQLREAQAKGDRGLEDRLTRLYQEALRRV